MLERAGPVAKERRGRETLVRTKAAAEGMQQAIGQMDALLSE